jgi:UDP-N-acetylglucosamine:LPS N-acetylglucosamine transferase
MPQESGAATMLARRGAGVLLSRATDIVPVVRRMVEDSRYYASLRAATAGLAFPDATRRIVEEIAALLPAPLASEDEPAPLEIRSA